VRPIATFSIAAYDAKSEAWGVAVQSKFLAVGAVVPWAQAGAGAVATQSYANVTYGPRGLKLMAEGMDATGVITRLTADDEQREQRQVGVVDAMGRAAAFTGSACYEWAGHHVGDGYCCQGNILIPGTIEAMAAGYEAAQQGDGELADWLVAALRAAQDAGGDRRGRQSAAVLVVREGAGYGGNNDRYLDLRVDDDPFPIEELSKLLQMHHLYFQKPDPDNLVPLSDVARRLQLLLQETGYYQGPASGDFDRATRIALRALVGTENLEERWEGDSDYIDRKVIEFLMDKYR
jgi:uncharacterized Ntn-hydrolase superfamily protein